MDSYSMTLIKFTDTVKNERTGQYEEKERIEAMGVNMLMHLLYRSIPYKIVKEYR